MADDFEDICVEIGILRKMFLELQNLAVRNSYLSLAMATSGHSVQQRLHMLRGITDIIEVTQDSGSANRLIQRARLIAARLVEELEGLAIRAEHEFECVE